MAAHRRVHSAQAAPAHPSSHFYPPFYQQDPPDYDYDYDYDYNQPPQPQPQPPPSRPVPTSGPPSSSYFTNNPSTLVFPEPQLYRSTSVGSVPPPRPALTVSDYDARNFLGPNGYHPYGTTEPALDPASFGYGATGSTATGSTSPTIDQFPNPYGSGSGRQFSESSYSFGGGAESSYSFGGGDTYSFSTSESPERSPSLTFSHLR